MAFIFAILLLLVCARCIYMMSKRQDGSYYILGTVALFSLGYYVLPVFFDEYSGLAYVRSGDVAEALGMVLLFFLFLVFGHSLAEKYFLRRAFGGVRMPFLGAIFERNPLLIFGVGLIVWMAYFFTNTITSYQAVDSEVYFVEGNALAGLLSALAGFAMSAMAVAVAMCFGRRSKLVVIAMFVLYFLCVSLLLSTAQRLSVIAPVFTLMAALAVFGNSRASLRVLVAGIVVLLVVSPAMVFLREFQAGSDKSSSFSDLGHFAVAVDGAVMFFLQSIMQRADLVDVMIDLKKHIDINGFVSSQYYVSIIYSFIPRFIAPDKPFPLSDDGTIWGELSVVAWLLRSGQQTGIGSLTAFGAISAYREGGWIWVPLNGMLTGASFALLFAVLGRGDVIARWFFCFLFVGVAIRNVPPSLFQLWVFLAAPINALIVAIFVDRLFRRRATVVFPGHGS